MSALTEAATDALTEVAAAAGLRVDASVDGDAVAALSGPFLVVEVPSSDGEGISMCIALKDTMSDDAEELLGKLAGAVAAGNALSPSDPVGAGTELVARFPGPYEVSALSDGTTVQAVILTAVERRGPDVAGPADLGAAAVAAGDPILSAVGGFDKLVNVALDVSVELGRTRVTLSEVLDFDVGSVIELDRAAGAPVDVRVNGMLLAQGEVVLLDDEYAVRITAIVDPRTEK